MRPDASRGRKGGAPPVRSWAATAGRPGAGLGASDWLGMAFPGLSGRAIIPITRPHRLVMKFSIGRMYTPRTPAVNSHMPVCGATECRGICALLAPTRRLVRDVRLMYTTGMTLAKWMAEHGVDDETMGNLVQVDRVTISRIRRGLSRPSWPLAGRIKKITGGAVTADDHLPGEAPRAARRR